MIAEFEKDPETELIVMCGEIGGDEEERTAEYIGESVTKPVVAYIAGFTAPPGKTMGHAGAIVSGSSGTAVAKAEALEAKGVRWAAPPPRWPRWPPRWSAQPPRTPPRDASLRPARRADIVRGMADPMPISFARGAPSLDIVAVDGLRAAADAAFASDPGGTCMYGTAIGYVPLREWIAEKHGVPAEQVIVTNGSMQADAFLFQECVAAGDQVIVEAPTYDRTLLSLRGLGAEVHRDPARVRRHRRRRPGKALDGGARPKLAHVIPNFHNPGGCTLSLAKRKRLVELAAQFGFLIFEDDPYVDIRFAGEPLPTDARARPAARPRRLCLLVLQDGLPGHPRRLPRGRGRPHRPDREDRDRTPTSRRTWLPSRS